MRRSPPARCVVAVLAVLFFHVTDVNASTRASLTVVHSQSAYRVPRYDVVEITFELRDAGPITDPLDDVGIAVRVTGPEGGSRTVGGFLYDASTWKARFAPEAVGQWRYEYTLRAPAGIARGEGSFECIPSSSPGFLRINPQNPFTWVFDNGVPFNPLGIQDCVLDLGPGSVFTNWVLEAGDCHGPWRGPYCDADTYLRTYAQAGFNLFRFSQANCSYNISEDLDHYSLEYAIWTDQLLEKLQDHQYRILYGFFGYAKAFVQEPDNEAAMQKVRRFLKYSVDRWGAYVDIWELLNEQRASDEWVTMMADYVHSIDPYHHPVATSWERPELESTDVNTPHWYPDESFSQSDIVTAERAIRWKEFRKPVIVDEHGNGGGAVWDYTSALRMRARLWTALFNQISVVFWNSSWAPNGHYMNMYLGPEERQYIRALQNFAHHLASDMKPMEVMTSNKDRLRAYGLASAASTAVYVHFSTWNPYADWPDNASITLDVPHRGSGYWMATGDGSLLASLPVAAGRQTIALPTFKNDCALFITDEPVSAPPLAVIKANPQFGLAPQTTVLDGRESAAAFGGRITSYRWDFGDGTPSAEGPVVVHTYPYGSYLVTLTVTDAAGARGECSTMLRITSSLVTGLESGDSSAHGTGYADLPGIAPELDRIRQATSTNRPPAARAFASVVSGPPPVAVHFTGQGADADEVVVRYHWNFGDGTSATSLDADHLYTQPGTYAATLTVWDDQGASGSAAVTVVVKG